MPIIGEIQTGKELGRSNDGHRFVYSTCKDCGVEKWFDLRYYKEKPLRCYLCSHRTEQMKAKISKIKKGGVSAFKGRTHTLAARMQSSLSHKGHIVTGEQKLKLSQSVKAYYKLHPEIWDKLHKSNIGRRHTPEQNVKNSLRRKEQIVTEEQKIKISQSLKEYYKLHPEQREIIHKRNYGRRHTPEELDRTVRGIIKASHMRPNKCETGLGELINRVTSDYKYNGGGELGVVLGGRIPDFFNINGEKQVINFNGCHWHSCPVCFPEKYVENNSRNNIQPYIDLGYKVLVIWEHELLDERNVLNKIKDFCGVSSLRTSPTP